MLQSPITAVVQSHGYADGAQSYLVIKSSQKWHSVKAACEACVADIGLWMDNNMLKLNQGKDRADSLFPRGTRVQAKSDKNITVGDSVLSVVPCVRNLGVMMDCHLTMEKQVNTIFKSCCFQVRNIEQIRQHKTDVACKTLVQALIMSTPRLCQRFAECCSPGDVCTDPAGTEHGSAIGH